MERIEGECSCCSFDGMWSTCLTFYTQYIREGWSWQRSRVEKPWPSSEEILAEEGTQWYFLADKPHISCLPRDMKRDVLLNQKPGWNHSFHISYLHPKVTSDIILILTSIPKLLVFGIWAPLSEHDACLESLKLHLDTKKYCKSKLITGRS